MVSVPRDSSNELYTSCTANMDISVRTNATINVLFSTFHDTIWASTITSHPSSAGLKQSEEKTVKCTGNDVATVTKVNETN